MADVKLPIIPENIVVHLGKPTDKNAANITVPFPDYIKNVASSEIYPTWPENAIRANVYAQITYALNRVYTEFYRSKGYDFDITNSTQFDQSYVQGREIFDNIAEIVDDIFNDYVQKQGTVEPYFTQYCNGTTTKCAGLSQWGTVGLAEKGLSPYEILQNYYGENIYIVENAPIKTNIPTYPGIQLVEGSGGNEVKSLQIQLNRIANNYPAIPKIPTTDGIYGAATKESVKKFQEIFDLPVTGNVDKSTWYQIKYIFNGVKKLGELSSEGLTPGEAATPYPTVLKEGSTGLYVQNIQYYLNTIGYFIDGLDPVEVDGIFGPETKKAVQEFQKMYGLVPDGIVGRNTWNKMQEVYLGIIKELPVSVQGSKAKPYPGRILKLGSTGLDVTDLQTYLQLVGKTYTNIPEVKVTGVYDKQTEDVVRQFQKEFGIKQLGVVGPITWDSIAREYDEIRIGSSNTGMYAGM